GVQLQDAAARLDRQRLAIFGDRLDVGIGHALRFAVGKATAAMPHPPATTIVCPADARPRSSVWSPSSSAALLPLTHWVHLMIHSKNLGLEESDLNMAHGWRRNT